MTVESVLDGSIKEGDLLPSVRSVAEQFQVSPLTVLKGHQELVNEGVVEVHRGRGMFIRAGARRSLLQHEWPRIESKIHRLGIQLNELLGPGASAAYPKSAGPMTRKH